MRLGAGFHSETPSQEEPKHVTPAKYRSRFARMYYSQASLERVQRVECFLGDTQQDRLGWRCPGVILEYSDGCRASLGECRVGMSKTIHAIAPTMVLYLKASSYHQDSRAWFTSSADEAEKLKDLGWEERPMGGTLTWWFEDHARDIFHSSDSTGEDDIESESESD